MRQRLVALAFALLPIVTASASDGLPLSNVCAMARATMPVDKLVEQWNTSPEHARLLADAGDGRLDVLRKKLSAMPREEASQWRQSTMMFAVEVGQPDVVAAMLDDGADASAPALLPGYKAASMAARGSPSTLATMRKYGLLIEHEQTVGPALPIAAECGDVAVVNVLLRHHADVRGRQAPNVADALDAAVLQGNGAIVQRLLDHGASSCAHDRLGRERMRQADGKFIPLAELGRRAGLPADLIKRLTCSAPLAAR